MFSDVLALNLSMFAIYYCNKKENKKYTYGYLRFEVIASFINGIILFVIALGVIYEALHRNV